MPDALMVAQKRRSKGRPGKYWSGSSTMPPLAAVTPPPPPPPPLSPPGLSPQVVVPFDVGGCSGSDGSFTHGFSGFPSATAAYLAAAKRRSLKRFTNLPPRQRGDHEAGRVEHSHSEKPVG